MNIKITLLFVILILFQKTYCQNNTLNYELTMNGNYNRSTKNISIGSYKTDLKSNNTRLEFGINRFITNRLMFGLDLNYYKNTEQFDYSYYNVDNGFVVEDYPEIATSIFIPSINLKYVYSLTDRLYIGLNLSNGYGISTTKMKSETHLKVDLVKSDLLGSAKGFEKKSDESFYSLTLEPEICYYFTNSIGLKLKGDFYRFDTQNKSQFFFDTKSNQPIWTLGLSWKI